MVRVMKKHHPLLKTHILNLCKIHGWDIRDILQYHQDELTSRGISEAKLIFYEQYHVSFWTYEQRRKEDIEHGKKTETATKIQK